MGEYLFMINGLMQLEKPLPILIEARLIFISWVLNPYFLAFNASIDAPSFIIACGASKGSRKISTSFEHIRQR